MHVAEMEGGIGDKARKRHHRHQRSSLMSGAALAVLLLGAPSQICSAAQTPAPAAPTRAASSPDAPVATVTPSTDANTAPATPAPANPAPTASNPAVESPIAILLGKAQFWYERGNWNVALDTYDRVLGVEPTNVDALVGASKVAVDMGREDLVQSYITRLRKIAPDDPWVAAVDTARRRSPAEAAAITEARHLTVIGRHDEALAKYRSVMHDNKVPDELAAEYYPLLISSLPQNSVEADSALAALQEVADRKPKDQALQLALAQAMIIGEGTRGDGIARLREMSHNPQLSNRVRPIWREALLWQGPSTDALNELAEYLKENPTDPQIEAKMAEFRASLPTPALQARMLGYEAINANNLKDAEHDFNDALAADSTDADATVMLGVIRLKQNRVAEAKALVDKAISMAPDRREEFLSMTGLDPVANAKAAAEAARAVTAQYKEVARLTDAGDYTHAETLLRQLIGNHRDAGGYLQLADIQTRADKPDAAAESLRQAVSIDPTNADVLVALAASDINQGRTADADALLTRAEAELTRTGNTQALTKLHQAQADRMRVDAVKIGNLTARETALRAALAKDPSSWWTRLEIARVMAQTNRLSDAQAMMTQAQQAATAPDALQTQSGQDALQVAFVWAQERGDTSRANALARLVPANSRPAGMQRLLEQENFAHQVDAIAQGRDVASSTAQLLALANHPDPDGTRGVAIAHAFLKRHDIANLRQALSAGLMATVPSGNQQRLGYAGVLMEASQFGAANSVLQGIDLHSLTANQRTGYESLRSSLIASRADRLVAQNQPDQAEQLLQPLLETEPTSEPLKLAMARVQIAKGDSSEGLATLVDALKKDPKNTGLRMGAIGAAVSTGQLSLAQDLIDDGLKLDPKDANLTLQAANVARARGLNGLALDYMVKARALRATAAQ